MSIFVIRESQILPFSVYFTKQKKIMAFPKTSLFLLFLSFLPQYLLTQNVLLDIDGHLQLKEGASSDLMLQSDAEGWGTWVKPITQQRKIIDVTDFGAVADFSTDNAAAFQAAIDSAATFGGVVFIPAGNYVIQQELKVPSGVVLEGESQGGDYHSFANVVRGSCLIYTGLEYVAEFRGFFSGAKNIYFYNSGTGGVSKGKGCLKLLADDGQFSTGYNSFSNLYMYNFFEGTCLKIEAINNSRIANVIVEDVLFRFPETGMHILAETGSTIQHITLLNGKIGGGSKYSFRNQGGTNINVYGTTFEGLGCGSFGHLVVESGNINVYGFRTESTDSEGSCDEGEIIIAHFFPETKGSYLRGITGDGRVLDEGENHLDVAGRNIGRRPSGYNQFQNSAFKGVENNVIPKWEVTGNVTSILSETPVFEDELQVISLRIPAGEIVQLTPSEAYMPAILNHQFGAFGAYIKTDSPNVAFSRINTYSSSDNTCSVMNSSFHSGDNEWQYIGLPAGMNSNVCDSNPHFVFDNSNGGKEVIIAITAPSFVFGYTRPTLAAKPLLTAGGTIDGTLTTGLIAFPIATSAGTYELTLPFEGNTFLLTEVGTIIRLNNITGTRFPKGTMITLLFESANTRVKNNAYINLLGSEDYLSTVGSSLTLVALASGVWREIGRNL